MPEDPALIDAAATGDSYDALIRLWCLRLLTHGQGHRALAGGRGAVNDDLVAVCGLPQRRGWRDEDELSQRQILRLLEQNLADAESEFAGFPGFLEANVTALGERLGLSEDERKLLMLLVTIERSEEMEEAVSLSLQVFRGRPWMTLAHALGTRVEAIRHALGSNGLLLRSGLVQQDGSGHRRFRRLGFCVLPHLVECMMADELDPKHMFHPFFSRAPEPSIRESDIPHLAGDLRQMEALLRAALDQGRRGVNILLYGEPGTGKTELARLLAHRAGWDLKEVSHTAKPGEPMPPRARLGAWALCQHLLSRSPDTLVLFDEIEDAFEVSRFPGMVRMRHGTFDPGKAWINDCLDHNPVPCIWIANTLHDLDPAHLRRFAMVREITTPPAHVRRAILKRYFGPLGVSEAWQRRVAAHPHVTPAQISRIAEVCELAAQAFGTEEREAFLAEQFNRHLELQHRPPLPPQRPNVLPWKLDFLQADRPLKPLFEGLKRSGQGSVLLYGSPGTGKTAFARSLAEHLQRPLIAKAASDLLDPFLGMTERRIARMFRDAEQQGAVLLLDEADSLLRSRERASVSWEVTQVNELLMRMEAHPGVFICATNLPDVIDLAAMRRFDVKVHLGFPKPERRWKLFLHLLRTLGLEVPRGREAGRLRARLDTLDQLAPGDFATVARRHQRLGEVMAIGDVLDGLASEVRYKGDGQPKRVGFV